MPVSSPFSMARRSLFSLLSFMILLNGVPSVLLAQSGPLELTDAEREWIAENPVIRVHNEMDWPPFNFNEDGQPRGYSVDYMNLVAERLGLTVEYVSGPTWIRFLEMMKRQIVIEHRTIVQELCKLIFRFHSTNCYNYNWLIFRICP